MARNRLGDELYGRGRDILELERDASAALGEARQGRGVAPVRCNVLISNGSRTGLRGGIEGLNLVAEATCRDGRHPAELTTPKNSNRTTRQQRTFHGSALLTALLARDGIVQHCLSLLGAELV